jgi:NACHT domain
MCADGTRTEILTTIHRWFNENPLETEGSLSTEGNPRGQIFWLDGVAGTGKSTIAQTIAYQYHKTGELGASFFCSRDDADCSNINMIFPTLAYQLCSLHPLFQERVSDALRKDVDLQSAFASMQLEKLIVEPLEAVLHDSAFKFPPCLIVIDALDECKDENATSTILTALSVFTSRSSPLKFFITSRPVANVQQGFRVTGLMNDTNALVLHSIPNDISRKDIQVYLDGRLSLVARLFELESWPSSEILAQLVELSNGLFIFAATVVNFIEDRNASDPIQQLKLVLSSADIASTTTSPYHRLDELYLTVLHEAFPEISDRQRVRLRTVLGAVVVLFDPLNPGSLEALLDLDKSMVRLTLRHLHSIIIVPDDRGGSVQLLHLSFRDFLVDADRCTDANFVVDAQSQHTALAERCLRVLQTLLPDVCNIGDPSVYNQEVIDLPGRIAAHIPAHVQYACRHWGSHLSSSNIHDTLLGLLQDFCLNQLLNWLEVMSLLGELGGAITSLHSAHRAIKVRNFDFAASLVIQGRWLITERSTFPDRDSQPSG